MFFQYQVRGRVMRRSSLVFFSLLLAACTAAASSTPSPNPLQQISPTENSTAPAMPVPGVTPHPTNIRVDDDTIHEVPPMLGFDGIRPIYDPEFVPASQAPLLDEELVMGVVLGGEAKAYPVTVLRTREMVIDDLAGWHILVSW